MHGPFSNIILFVNKIFIREIFGQKNLNKIWTFLFTYDFWLNFFCSYQFLHPSQLSFDFLRVPKVPNFRFISTSAILKLEIKIIQSITLWKKANRLGDSKIHWEIQNLSREGVKYMKLGSKMPMLGLFWSEVFLIVALSRLSACVCVHQDFYVLNHMRKIDAASKSKLTHWSSFRKSKNCAL